jgi:hypothetical protein
MMLVQKKVTIQLLRLKRLNYITNNFECLFNVSVVDSRFVGQPRERSQTTFYNIKASMTWELRVDWRMDDDSDEMNVLRVLREYCSEYVAERIKLGLPIENELLLSVENSPDNCPYDISLITDPTTVLSFTIEFDFQSVSLQGIELYVDDIDSFNKVRNVKPQEVKTLLPLNLSENEIQTFLEEILGENFHQDDWGGELNDLITSFVRVGGKRMRAAFLLKGNGTKGKLTIAKCGKNGDQIVRLFEAPVGLYIIQHVGEIDQRVIFDLWTKVQLKVSKGEKCQMCVLDGTETARILRAYGKI